MRNRTKGPPDIPEIWWNSIYLMYVEELPDIPETSSKYVEIPPIYSKYVGEPHSPRNAALADNDSSYVLRRRNMSLAYHTVSKNFN